MKSTVSSGSALALDDVAELIASCVPKAADLDVLIYGSTIQHGEVVGDVDVWVEGVEDAAQEFTSVLSSISRRFGFTADVAHSPTVKGDMDEATRWCVHQDGLLVAGRRPARPAGMTFYRAESIYRRAVQIESLRLARYADVLARAGATSAASYTEAAVRRWVQSSARDHAEEREWKRLPTMTLVRVLGQWRPDLGELLERRRWDEVGVTDPLLAEISANTV